MMKLLFIIVGAVLLFAPVAYAVDFTFKDNGQIVQTLSIEVLAALAPTVEKTVYDPLEQASITYKAIPLKTVIDKIYGEAHAHAEEILLTCSDGFKPSIAQEQFDNASAYLAFERVGQKSFSLTNKLEGNKRVELSPVYLIWDLPKNAPKHEWAYMIVGLDRVSFAKTYPQIAPLTAGGIAAESAASVQRGFVAFRNHCLACHTINGEGGDKAPELNFPVNITEYYNETWLRKWIADPTSIRFSTTMPALAVDPAEREVVMTDLIAYLKLMAYNKRQPLMRK
jgi:mono/diheme cytochrome c family protein